MICGHCGESIDRTAGLCPSCSNSPLLDGRYRLLEVLGQGASGVTYRAERAAGGQKYALKEMAFRTMESMKAQELFEREARVLESLDHPAIPSYVDDFTAGEGHRLSLYLVQELIEGQDLEAEMEGRRYDEREALDVLAQLLDILAYLHDLKPPVIHRDIKPSNIMRVDGDRDENSLRLIDFGSVRAAVQQTQVGGSTIAGTFGFMAPEQLVGRATPATDIYSAAVLTVALLTRVDPVELVDDANVFRWQDACEVSPSVASLLEEMLAQSPSERPQEAGALAERVRDIREGRVEGSGEAVEGAGEGQPADGTVAQTGEAWQPPAGGESGESEDEADWEAASAPPALAEVDAPMSARALKGLDDAFGAWSVSRVFETDFGSGGNRFAASFLVLFAGWFGYLLVSAVTGRLYVWSEYSGALWEYGFLAGLVGFGLLLMASAVYVPLKAILWGWVNRWVNRRAEPAGDASDRTRAVHQVLRDTRVDATFSGWTRMMMALMPVFITVGWLNSGYLRNEWSGGATPDVNELTCPVNCGPQAPRDERGCCAEPCPENEVWDVRRATCESYEPQGLALRCPEGMEKHDQPSSNHPEGFLCCWPGQRADLEAGRCLGPPACPEGRERKAGTCVSRVSHDGVTVIPAASFAMQRIEVGPDGAKGDREAEPARDARVGLSFAMEQTEVTQAEWKSVMSSNPSRYAECGPDCPVERVNWFEALVYANRRSVRDGLEQCYWLEGCRGTLEETCSGGGDTCEGRFRCDDVWFKGNACRGWRLPFEVEWHHAARLGLSDTEDGMWGGKPLAEQAWFAGNHAVDYDADVRCVGEDGAEYACGPHPVAGRRPNVWGLYDVLGNVEEWTMNAATRRTQGTSADLLKPAGGRHVVRGCHFLSPASECRVGAYWARPAESRSGRRGLRLVRTVPYFGEAQEVSGDDEIEQ